MLLIDETNIKAIKTRLNTLGVEFEEEEFCGGTDWDTGSRFDLSQPVTVDGVKVDKIVIHGRMTFYYKNEFKFNAANYFKGKFDFGRLNLPAKPLNIKQPAKPLNIKQLMTLSVEEVNQLFNDLILTRGPDLVCSNCGEQLGDAVGENVASIDIEVEDIPGGQQVTPHITCKNCR
jgi:hypothetical protein